MKASDFLPRRQVLNVFLVSLSIITTVTMYISSSDLKQIVFDISVGILVSLLIYLLVAVIPEHQKRKRVRRNLTQQYDSFKEQCIFIFLSAMKEAADRVLVKRLKDRIFFREYFHEKVSPSQERWHVVLNGLNDRLVRDLIVELEILMNEIQYTLATIDIDNPEALDFLKSLSQMLYRGKNWTSDYDDVKAISRFLWSVHTGWDWQKGYADKDIISGIIEAI